MLERDVADRFCGWQQLTNYRDPENIIIVIFYHILFAKKRRRATRKAEAHHTLVAHYIMIVNVRIKHTTHISTYKHSKQVYDSTHYTLTHSLLRLTS